MLRVEASHAKVKVRNMLGVLERKKEEGSLAVADKMDRGEGGEGPPESGHTEPQGPKGRNMGDTLSAQGASGGI